MRLNGKCVSCFLVTNSIAHHKTGGTSEQDIVYKSSPVGVVPSYGLSLGCAAQGLSFFSCPGQR